MKKTIRISLLLALAVSLLSSAAYAGPPRPPRGGSRPNVNVNKNVNVDVDRHGPPRGGRDVDVDIDVDRRGCCYPPPPPRHPVATAAAVTATAVVTSAVVGSIVYSLPPNCSTVIINGFAYQQCGNVWYQPQISAGSTTYIVVNSPR